MRIDPYAPSITFFLLFLGASASFSGTYRDYGYAEVDKHALSFRGKDFGSISKLADSLTRPFTEDAQKARSIYRWITDNIAYDCKAYHNPDQRADDYEDVLKSRKAVCSGYASLFKALCDFSGLDCEVINGYARFSYQGIGDQYVNDNHAWNAVMINEKWQLVDVTWGSGYTDEKIRSFTKSYSDYYFFTDPKQFILNHFPNDKKWQLLDRSVSRKKFVSYPYIWDGFYQNKVVAFAPKKGIIHINAGQAVRFRFKTDKEVKISTASVYTDLNGKPNPVRMKNMKRGVKFDYIFPEKGMYYISLALNSEYTLVYKVIAK